MSEQGSVSIGRIPMTILTVAMLMYRYAETREELSAAKQALIDGNLHSAIPSELIEKLNFTPRDIDTLVRCLESMINNADLWSLRISSQS